MTLNLVSKRYSDRCPRGAGAPARTSRLAASGHPAWSLASLALIAGVLGPIGTTKAEEDAGRRDSRRERIERFTLQQPQTVAEFLDVGAPGPSVGDKLFFHGPLFDRRGQRQVGSERGACEIGEVAAGASHCYVTFRFGESPRNTVEAAGEFFFNPDATVTSTAAFSIIGGTGRFRGSSGQITITNLSADGTRARQDWTLRR